MLQDWDGFNIGSRWQAVISLCPANTAGFDAGNLSVSWALRLLHCTEFRAKLHCNSAGLLNFEREGGCLGMIGGGGVSSCGGGGCAVLLEQSMLTPPLC